MNHLTTKKPHQLKIKFPKTARFVPLHLPKSVKVDNAKHHRHCVDTSRNGKIDNCNSMADFQRVLKMIIEGYTVDRQRLRRVVEMFIASYNANRMRQQQSEQEKSP